MFGDAIDPLTLPKDAVILQPHWNCVVKRSGVRRSRQCCNGSKFTAPLLHAMVSTWSSCVELPIQQLFIGLSAQKGLCMYGGDARDAYAHAPAPEMMTYLTIACNKGAANLEPLQHCLDRLTPDLFTS